MAQNIADHQLAARLLGRRHDPFRIGDRGCQRLLDKDVASCFEGHDGIVGMAVGIGADRTKIRLQRLEGVLKISVYLISGKLRRQHRLRAVDEADDLEAGIVVIGERMAAAHIAEAGDENANWLLR